MSRRGDVIAAYLTDKPLWFLESSVGPSLTAFAASG